MTRHTGDGEAPARGRAKQRNEDADEVTRKTRVDRLVDNAVKWLRVGTFIRESVPHFGPKLEKNHEYAKARGTSDMIFVALSLPIANGVIDVGSDQEAVSLARAQITRATGGRSPDPNSILSVLVLMAIVKEARAYYSRQAGKQEIWAEIGQRMEGLAKGLPPGP